MRSVIGKKILMNLAAVFAMAASIASGQTLRAPAVPLVACDPYFSIWSQASKLTDADTTHWTGKPNSLASLIRVDGKTFRLMGTLPADLPAMEQESIVVLPTRTIYTFAGAGVRVRLTFLTPQLSDDLNVLSRPVTYLTWDVESTDHKNHAVAVYFDATAECVVNQLDQPVVWSREKIGSLTVAKMGTQEQDVLGKRGDDIRIDWGYLYVATAERNRLAIGSADDLRAGFARRGMLPETDDAKQPRAVKENTPASAVVCDLGQVGGQAATCRVILAYDDIESIQYFGKNLKGYWARNGWTAADLIRASDAEYDALAARCDRFDRELCEDLKKIGGEKYAQICALAYRQCNAATKIVADGNGQPLAFPKENHSNGCIGTVDVIYPMAPQFLLMGPSLTKALVVYVMDYSASERWKFPFAPHDLGQYPHANGQRYGGGERTEHNQMPVEETGNMLILLAALAQMEGNADFSAKYWPVLERWAEYLKLKGFDPENQLCTDDFAGHLAHNVNLSAKAICGLASFARLREMRGETAMAHEDFKLAREFAARWIKEADDGDHFRLAFDKPGTWSQKYNLVWDRILDLKLFPTEVAKKDMAYYRRIQNRFGLPLDNRKEYTKLDWTLWTATLTRDRADFDALLAPVYDFVNETPDRSPLTDWYQTKTGKKVGFTARSVVGGVFLETLYHPELWKKWAGRNATKAANWAPIPKRPNLITIVPTAETQPATWRFTTKAPKGDWQKPEFDASGWSEGRSGFGTEKTPGAIIGTVWNASDIWLRREVELPAVDSQKLALWVHHDEDVEIFINGVLAGRATGFTSEYRQLPMRPEAQKAIRQGKNTIAVHCLQTRGGQYVDVGIVKTE